MPNFPEQDDPGLILRTMMRHLFSRGRQEVERIAGEGRKQIDLRGLRRDRARMYEKLGKEVEQLIAIGQVTHPGLQRGFQRLQEIQHQIEAAEQAVAAGLAEDNDEE